MQVDGGFLVFKSVVLAEMPNFKKTLYLVAETAAGVTSTAHELKFAKCGAEFPDPISSQALQFQFEIGKLP